MAFTVGVGPEASSYVDVAYADSYFADRGQAAWGAAQLAAKQAALVRATDYVRAWFATRFDPVLFVTGVPDVLARATCEYGLVELAKPGALSAPPAVDASGYSVVSTKRKVGPLERDGQVVGVTTRGPMLRRPYPVADALIATLLLPSTAATSVIR